MSGKVEQRHFNDPIIYTYLTKSLVNIAIPILNVVYVIICVEVNGKGTLKEIIFRYIYNITV